MILGDYKLKNWKEIKTVGTTKLDGVEVLGKFNRLRNIVATRHSSKIEALSAISNYCHSRRFFHNCVKKWNLVFDVIRPVDNRFWYISVNEKLSINT